MMRRSYYGVDIYNKVDGHIYPSIPFVVRNCTLIYLESMCVLFQAEKTKIDWLKKNNEKKEWKRK